MNWTEEQAAAHLNKRARQQAPKPSKYKAQKTTVDGIVFDSKKEARRYHELKLMEKAGEIQNLALQRPFELTVNYNPEWPEDADVIGTYVADFSYFDVNAGKLIVEDVKGFRTPLYRWKKKHFEAQYGIQIRET